jgi:hypothetical protein
VDKNGRFCDVICMVVGVNAPDVPAPPQPEEIDTDDDSDDGLADEARAHNGQAAETPAQKRKRKKTKKDEKDARNKKRRKLQREYEANRIQSLDPSSGKWDGVVRIILRSFSPLFLSHPFLCPAL